MNLYDTLTAEKRPFVPADGRTVRMYVCGVTPYSDTHIGHAMSYVVFDTIRRWFEYRGWKVEHVQNFTDIDDKIIARAQREGVPSEAVSRRYIQDFCDVMDALNVRRATRYPLATEEVPEIIRIISGLIDKGHAYAAGGDVYFRVTSMADYGKLSHRTLEGMVAGARIEVDPRKEHPMDFALWKAAKPGEPSWDSPWGAGRPGWHIECTAMSMRYLGATLDVHGGGADLVFPHHENEIAQSECFSGVRPFVRFWLHNGLLTFGGDKMSKSLGNLIPVREALTRWSVDGLRLFFLSSHYRRPLAFSEEGVRAAESGAERLRNALVERGPAASGAAALDPAPYRDRFTQAMDDDLNTPQAIAALFDLARETNRTREAGQDVREAQAALRDLGGSVLGLTFQAPAVEGGQEATPFVALLVEVRQELRKAKQFALADSVRDRLSALGVVLEDTPRGTEWKFRPKD